MQVQVTENTPRLDRVEEALRRKEYLSKIANAGAADIKRNFSTQGGNIGRTWPALAWRKGQRLRDQGQLMRSVHPAVSGDTASVSASMSRGGVNIAAVQHFGAKIKVTKKMRNFLGWARGIWLRKDKKEIIIPATEFMTFSDRFQKQVKFILGKVFK